MQTPRPFSIAMVLLLAFGAKALFLISGGAIYGRLSLPPPYDDVSYFVDALERLYLLRDGDVVVLLRDGFSRPPHAPYSMIGAMLAFGLGGANVAGPYLVNALAIAAIVAVLVLRFRMSLLAAGVTAAVLVSTKWFDDTVTIYHPDLIAGLAAAAVAGLLIWQADTISTKRAALGTALFSALALLVKPVAAGMILLLWAIAFAAGAAIAYRQERTADLIKMRLLFGAAPALLLVSPYFATSIVSNIEYIYLGFVAQRDIWAARLRSNEHDLFYLKEAAQQFVGWVAAALIIVGGTVAIAGFRRDIGTILRVAALVVVTAVAWAVPQYIDTKHFLYGAMLYACIALLLTLSVHYLIDRAGLSRAVTNSIAAVIVVFALLGLSDKQGRYDASAKAAVNQEYDGVYQLIRQVIAERRRAGLPSANSIVFYAPLPVPVPPKAYRFRGLLERVDIVPLPTLIRELPQMIAAASRANIVVAPDVASLGAIYPYPVRDLVPAFRKWLEQDTRLKLIGTVRTERGSADVFADIMLKGPPP